MVTQLLDCTLRDGGYINQWNFGKKVILSIFEHLQNANIEIIEVGFLNDKTQFSTKKTINPKTKNFDSIFSEIDKKSMTVAMVNFGNCNIKNIDEPAFLDGIRVIFKKHNINEAIDYCKAIQEKGYKVFVQPVSITTYSDSEMLNLIEKVNLINPYSISIVDTYGLMHKKQLLHYFELINKNLNEDIKIDYHSHNNLQLAYSNSIEFIEISSKRNKIIDASLYGMGKNAGNTCTELVAMYLNNYLNKNYNLEEILIAINNNIIKYKKDDKWGYCLSYFISALNNCNTDYIQYLKNKNFDLISINKILKNLDKEKQLIYDEDYIKNYLLNSIN